VQYFTLFPTSGNCAATGLTDEAVAQIRPIARDLSAITEAAVRPYRAFARTVALDRASADQAFAERRLGSMDQSRIGQSWTA
jgi:hypothetical protein